MQLITTNIQILLTYENESKLLILASLLLAGIISTQTASATDGYFSLAYGTQNKGMAGAGIAWYKNSLINGNPASLVKLGNQYQFGVNMFNPNREYTVTGNPSPRPAFGLAPGTVESDSKIFFILISVLTGCLMKKVAFL